MTLGNQIGHFEEAGGYLDAPGSEDQRLFNWAITQRYPIYK